MITDDIHTNKDQCGKKCSFSGVLVFLSFQIIASNKKSRDTSQNKIFTDGQLKDGQIIIYKQGKDWIENQCSDYREY